VERRRKWVQSATEQLERFANKAFSLCYAPYSEDKPPAHGVLGLTIGRARVQGSIMPHQSSVNLIVVRAAYDPDAKVWWVEDSAPLNGLNIEAATIDELRDKLPAAVFDLLETKAPGADIAIEVIGHMHTRVKIPVEPALVGLKY
jgi:Domain of unknown function (DUF1902)